MKPFSYLTIILLSLFSQSCYSQNDEYIKSSRLSLQNYGFSYCMKRKSEEKNLPYLDYSRALGIYLNNGNHNSPDVYNSVHSYITENIKSNNFKSFDGDNTTFSCLELYNSKRYEEFIESLDSYIAPESNLS